MNPPIRRVLTIVMDGVGANSSNFGNAVSNAHTPNLKWLQGNSLYRTIFAHGKHVGLPSDSDLGNSEVGHNALGAGRIFDQGAKLVQNAIDSSAIFSGKTWVKLLEQVNQKKSTLHFIGLLSDGNVHSHENHLYSMLRKAFDSGVKKIRVHILFDGRDVGERSAEIYVSRLKYVINELSAKGCDICIASGGGRMSVTMDRYEADWSMVQRGWNAHVHGISPNVFNSIDDAVSFFRSDASLTDQYIPSFVIAKNKSPVGKIIDQDAVVFFNFRGDRAIEISRAFTEEKFLKFDRGITPRVLYAGMMQYDGDLNIPPHYLVEPPQISDTLGEYLANLSIRQFACSETQKYGHVTYFWNGNRSGKFNESLEDYLEIPSDNIEFDLKPWMKAYEITEATIAKMKQNSFDFGRINFANGDMVGHTGNFEAAVIAVEVVDLMIGRLIEAAKETNTILMVTADHGNADEMFDAKEKDFADWKALPLKKRPTPKTAHTLSPVPLSIFDPMTSSSHLKLTQNTSASLGNIANTVLKLMGLPERILYLPSLVEDKA